MPFRRCTVCGDRIGVYEVAVAFEPDRERYTSLAEEPELEADPGAVLAHRMCVRTQGDRPTL